MVRVLLCGLAFAALAGAQATQSVSSVPSGAPVVDLGYAKYLGYVNETSEITYYRGIQYAQPPVGQLRWQKPRPIERQNPLGGAVFDATQIAPSCYQSAPDSLILGGSLSGNFAAGEAQSEDCLILDVLVPNTPQSTRLPVMVQIHGGGYTLGNAQSYPGDAMVHASNGSLIYVSIQYRLGLFGFLGGSQIADNGVLNAGLLDQRAALDWIQRNIRSFGGDPARVTIWGGSAGGGSVTFQLTASGANDEPPFSAAIAEYPWWQPMFNRSEQDTLYRTALTLSNCSTLQCLRGLSSDVLGNLNQQVQNASYPGPGAGYGSFVFGPVVDGEFVRYLPGESFKRGQFYDVPLLVDHEAYEGDIFSNRTQTTQDAEVADAMNLFPYAGPSFFSRLYQLYPRSDYNSTFFQRQTWFGDFIINCPTYTMASHAVDLNSNSSAVFKLTFAAGTELHGSTSVFLSNKDIDWAGANNRTLAEIMTSYWISFARAYDPNIFKLSNAPAWPSYNSGGNGTVANGESVGFTNLAVTYTTIGPAQDLDAGAKCDFFGNSELQVMN
ncbi:alpha/beta-hydrolase [Myriangium duriaei CBS 260.36]|uniref:Carboxylic ester hydrolase n=1 Tax=Myriangium duriaei CBS 260.36 TaxID=1168546 RepID=A0A9P4J2Y3_9PEZI|nr:alpha/beta-hydrolase [Myriangium duriaei CBS 260.36]